MICRLLRTTIWGLVLAWTPAAFAGTAQTLTFPAVEDHLTTDAPFSLAATASSGLAVHYSVVSSGDVATVGAGGVVTLTGLPGAVTVKATQGGDGIHDAAAAMFRSFVVYEASQAFVKLAQGTYNRHHAGIRADGSLWVWGRNHKGQLGLGYDSTTNPTAEAAAQRLGTANDWAAVACGGNYTVAIRTDGSLWHWGENFYNVTPGLIASFNSTVPVRLGNDTDWAQVICGTSGALALRTDGTLWAWGSNSSGQLGLGQTTSQPTPAQVGSQTWLSIGSGWNHSLAVRSDGTLWSWGDNSYKQLGDGTTVSRSSPAQVGTATNWRSVASGSMYFSVALRTDGSLWVWGEFDTGQPRDGTPVPVSASGWDSVACGSSHIVARRTDGTLWSWGSNWAGQLGLDLPYRTTTTTPAQIGTATTWAAVSCGERQTYALRANGSLWACGANEWGSLGETVVTQRNTPEKLGVATWKASSAGHNHAAAVRSDGTLWTWGGNNEGQLGHGDTGSHDMAQVGTDSDWKSVACARLFTLALRHNGTLWAWGDNGDKQLGDGTTTDRSAPAQVGTGTDWTAVMARDTTVLALRADGTLWKWGNATQPTQVDAATDWSPTLSMGRTDISGWHHAGLRADGSLWIWGNNEYRQTARTGLASWLTQPTLSGAAGPWRSVTCRPRGILAVRADGTLWDWGGVYNQGFFPDFVPSSPTQIGTATTWSFVDTAGVRHDEASHTVALRQDGTLWAWGSNDHGQAGVSATNFLSAPAQVGTGTGWVAVSPGFGFTVARRSDGSLWTWGNNASAQLGKQAITQQNRFLRIWPQPQVQTFRFFPLGSLAPGLPVALSVTTSSGLPPTFTTEGPATVVGNVLTPTGAGSVRLSVYQAGDEAWLPVGPGVQTRVSGPAASQIAVSGNGVNIASQDTTATLADHTDFGTATPAPGTVTRSFTVRNLGLADLILGTVTFSGPHAAEFSVAAPPAVKVPAGASTLFQVSFTPAGNGLRAATLTLPSNDADEPAFTFALEGTGAHVGDPLLFPALPPRLANAPAFALPGISTTGQTVTYSVVSTPGVAAVSGGVLTLTGQPGAVTVKASQPGMPPAEVLQTFAVGDPAQRYVRIATSSNASHSAGIRADGTLWTWGSNANGQLGDGTTVDRRSATQVGTDNDWLAVACGSSHTLALRYDGSLWSWGANPAGQLGDGTTTARSTPAPVQTGIVATAWTAIACGSSHSVAVRADGSLWAWGANSSGQLGDGTSMHRPLPVQIGTATDWTRISCGDLHTLALRSGGSLWAWGNNDQGQLGNGGTADQFSPTRVGTESGWSSVSAGISNTVALRGDGTLWTWGWATSTAVLEPTQLGTHRGWSMAVTGSDRNLAIRTDGTLWTWQPVPGGSLGDGTDADLGAPVQVGMGSDWTTVVAGPSHTLGLRADGSLWGWGDSSQLGEPLPPNPDGPQRFGTQTWRSVSMGNDFTVALHADGTLWAWGSNSYGQLGDGTTTYRRQPAQVGTANDWAQVSCGESHVSALRADGSLWTWGRYRTSPYGSDTRNYLLPEQVGTATDWKTVSCGAYHTQLLKTNGTLWAFGDNYHGQAGVTTSHNPYPNPQQVGTASNWTAVAAGGDQSVGLRADGTLWAWGHNFRGPVETLLTSPYTISMIGPNPAAIDYSPVQVGSSRDWKSLGAGKSCLAAIRNDGTLWRWGYDWFDHTLPLFPGGIGWVFPGFPFTPTFDPTTVEVAPVQVGGHGGFTHLSCGASHLLARDQDGRLWAMGSNHAGQLGDGTTTSSLTALVQVGTSTQWSAQLAGSPASSMALREDGTLWRWKDTGTYADTPRRLWPLSGTQSITFPAPPATLPPGHSLPLSATATSGLPVTYSVRGPATLDGNVLTTTGHGTVILIANQFGDESWQSADPIKRTVDIPSPATLARRNWRQTHFGTTTNSGTAADTVDADHDGLANLVEYAFGLSPVAGTSMQLPTPQRVDGAFTVSFTEPDGVTGITYGASYNTSLQGGSWIPIPDTGSGTTHTFSAPVGVGDTKVFIQLSVTTVP